MYIKKQPLTKEFIYLGHLCYDSYDDGYDNFDSLDDFDLNAWGKGTRLHYRTERRSGGQRSEGGVYSTKHEGSKEEKAKQGCRDTVRLAETRRNKWTALAETMSQSQSKQI